jgi:hypothetical protein
MQHEVIHWRANRLKSPEIEPEAPAFKPKVPEKNLQSYWVVQTDYLQQSLLSTRINYLFGIIKAKVVLFRKFTTNQKKIL